MRLHIHMLLRASRRINIGAPMSDAVSTNLIAGGSSGRVSV